MLAFICFHQNICKLFTDLVTGLSIEYQVKDDDETITVSVSEDVEGGLIEKIEDEYDRLLDLSRDQTDSEEGESRHNYQKACLLISLKNGDKDTQ